MEVNASGACGKVRTSKDVIFDETIDFLSTDLASLPSESDFVVDAVTTSERTPRNPGPFVTLRPRLPPV
jgi:hypothetical protein